MTHDLISKKARTELREYFVGTSLRIISQEFDAADVPCDSEYEPPEVGERRSFVEQYYHAVDFTKWSDVRKVLTVYENVLAEVEEQAECGADKKRQFNSLKKWIERDGFIYNAGHLTRVGADLHIDDVADAAIKLNAPELRRQIQRLRSSVEDDPGLAIGTAKELLETTCKTILTERELPYGPDWDVGKLVKATRKALGLVPDNISDSAKGVDSIRRILSSLGAVAQGLNELRNLYGTGHGKEGGATGLTPRHARLAVGAAATLATFLFETHEERKL
jgi:hypothetical protein